MAANVFYGVPALPQPRTSSSPRSDQQSTYWACLRKFREGWFGAFVPDILDAAGAGDTEQEALDDLKVKLSCEVVSMLQAGTSVPNASDYEAAEEASRKIVSEQGKDFPITYFIMVKVCVDLRLAQQAELSAEDLQRLSSAYLL